MAFGNFRGHPSPIRREDEIAPEETRWKNIGSGIFARTFKRVTSLPVTTKSGPYESDVQRRVVRSPTSGKVIDDCVVDDTADSTLRRSMPMAENIRVEITMNNALSFYQTKGADVVNIYTCSPELQRKRH